MASGNVIPLIDFKGVHSGCDFGSCSQVQELHSAFTEVGFVFIKNHGIDACGRKVEELFRSSLEFFTSPFEVKRQYTTKAGKDTNYCGYVAMEQESVDPSKPGDLKECFQLCPLGDEYYADNYSCQELQAFLPLFESLYKSSIELAHTILEMMGLALKLEDPQFFVKNHQKCGKPDSYTTARLLYYPLLSPDSDIKPGQLRCGEHVDYGSITLLFQDSNGGLQVKRCNGDYIDVPYEPDVVLVNLGALMQMWTGDKYLATPHRVLLPKDSEWKRVRQSMAVFIHPDHETLVRCIDGSDKYPPITALEDTFRRIHNSYDTSEKFS